MHNGFLSGLCLPEDQFKSRIEACEELERFLSLKREFEAGDYLAPNEFGKAAYTIGEFAAVKCIKTFTPKLKDREVVDCLIAVCSRKNKVNYYAVNSAHFQKIKEPKSNVSFLRRKK